MLGSELSQSLLFYLIFSLFSFTGLPVASRLIPNRLLAYAAAKLIGLILFGYLVWLLSSFKILDYQQHRVIFVLFTLVVVVGFYASRCFFIAPGNREPSDAKNKKRIWKNIYWFELSAFLIYAGYLFLRSHNAAIAGSENFMDMAMLTAAGKTHFFPFIDPWFAGKTVNYYYFGHYLVSLISNLSKTPYALSYNFALGLLFSQSILLAAVLTFAATKSKIAAVISTILINIAGTLYFAGCAINSAFSSTKQICSYFSASQLFSTSYIINEIPSYSFTVGNLHAHLLGLPFFLLNLILLYTLVGLKKTDWRLLVLISLGLSVSGLINAWDAITLFAVFSIILVIKIIKITQKRANNNFEIKKAIIWLVTGAGVGILAYIFAWPMLRLYQNPVMGLGFIPFFVASHGLKNVQYPTPFWAWLGIWGVLAAGTVAAAAFIRKKLSDHLFFLAIGTVAFGILIGVEILFVKDIYSIANPPYFRANTTFKFGYHAWVLLSLVFSVFMAGLYGRRGVKSVLAVIFILSAIVGGALYPLNAVNQFYLSNKSFSAHTLDGLKWLEEKRPGDWNSINYINQNIVQRSVIAEAVNNSYSEYSRLSTFTGMIAPMGWPDHEWIWRFQIQKAKTAGSQPGQNIETGWNAISQVASDIQQLYDTKNIDEAGRIIKKYNIAYIYVGELERTAYPNLQEQKFYRLGQVVFESSGSKLFIVDNLNQNIRYN